MRFSGRWAQVLLPAFLLAVSLLTMTGCHKHAKQAKRYPPPPTRSTTARSGDRRTYRDQDATGTSEERTAPKSSGAASGSLPNDLSVTGKPFETETGLASWYGPPYAGRRGADGTVYDQNAMTAAHLTLPLGTVVRVTNLVNGQNVVLKITDRGPFVQGRIIDLSLAAAKATGVYRAGVAKVRVEAFTIPPLKPNVLPGGRWCVQVGAFPNQAEALQEKAELLQRYPGAKVIEFAGPTGHWVRINPKIGDKAHATEVADSIHLPDQAQPYLIRTD